jgi:N utilization substance protein B
MQALYTYLNNRSVNLEEARRRVFARLIEIPEFYNAEALEKEGFKALLPLLLDDAFDGKDEAAELQEKQRWLAALAREAVSDWNRENVQEKQRILDGIQSDIKRQSEKEVFFWKLFMALATQLEQEEENRVTGLLPQKASAPHTLKMLQHPFLAVVQNALFPERGGAPTSFRSIDPEWVIRLYPVLFRELPEYQTYRDLKESSAEADHEIFKVLYRKLLRSEVFNEIMEEIDLRWSENRILLEVALKETFRRLTSGEPVAFIRDVEENEEFARFFNILFESSLTNREEDEKRLEGVITNWNSDRVALLDKYLIMLGINEMRNFPHIPVKVTINEYLEIAKAYSTPGSSSFINGVIDKMAKILQKEGSIKKSAKGMLDNR